MKKLQTTMTFDFRIEKKGHAPISSGEFFPATNRNSRVSRSRLI
jgi:hypothetical protein